MDSKMAMSFGDENLAVGCSVVDQGAIASWLEMTRRAWLTTCREILLGILNLVPAWS